MIESGKYRIVFMGSPEFAVPSLEKLYENGYKISAVITAPDKASGRGLKVRQPAVKEFAVSKDLLVLQPKNLKDPEFLNKLKNLDADLFVVVAFRMLPDVVWRIPPKGTINLHASLLPDYRGAAPINWVLINGETQTGLTTFFIEKEIDTGKIILQMKIQISEKDTAGSLHDKMKETGAHLVLETVDSVYSGNYTAMDQDINLFKHKAPKIFKEDCRINWNKKVEDIYNLVRGLSPFPTAWSVLNGKVIKIYRAAKIKDENVSAASVKTDNKTFLWIGCKDGWLDILELQMEGKKRLAVKEFLRGFRFDSQSTLV